MVIFGLSYEMKSYTSSYTLRLTLSDEDGALCKGVKYQEFVHIKKDCDEKRRMEDGVEGAIILIISRARSIINR